MNRRILITCILPLAVAVSSFVHAMPESNIDALRIQRQALVGPKIVEAPNYTVHMPNAIVSGEQVSCPASFQQSALSQSAQQQLIEEIIAEQDAINRDRNALYEQAHNEYLQNISEWNRQHKTGIISKQELVDRVRAAEANVERIRKAPASPEIQARINALEARRTQAGQRQGTLILYLQHQPTSPNETILPILGDHPAPAFVQDLNARLSHFIQSCKGITKIITLHYYSEGYRLPRHDNSNETEVVNYTFALDNDRLVYQPPVQKNTGNSKIDARIAAMQSGPFNWQRNPQHNRELTLVGFQGVKADISANESARETRRQIYLAEYRKEFEQQSKRKPGIVYFLDKHWYGYDNFDLPRRIFDGDFAYANQVEFKAFFMALADVYSKRCVSDPAELRQYNVPYREYAGSNWNMDGSRTVYLSDGNYVVNVDRRFTPQWGTYRPDVNAYWMSDFTNRSGEAKNLMRMNPKDFFATLSQSGKQMFREHEQMDRFITRHGCKSAAVAQLTENFVRAANDQSSAQDTGVQFVDARAESDPPLRN